MDNLEEKILYLTYKNPNDQELGRKVRKLAYEILDKENKTFPEHEPS